MIDDFALLFSKENETGSHSIAYKNYLSEFNTAISIDICAGGNFLNWELVLEKPVYDVLTYLQYRYAKDRAEAAELDFQQKKRGTK